MKQTASGDQETATGPVVRLRDLSEADNAERLRSVISEFAKADLVIDGSDVEVLGALNAQVLVSAAKTWARDDADFKIANPSEALRCDIALLGLGPQLHPHFLEEDAT